MFHKWDIIALCACELFLCRFLNVLNATVVKAGKLIFLYSVQLWGILILILWLGLFHVVFVVRVYLHNNILIVILSR